MMFLQVIYGFVLFLAFNPVARAQEGADADTYPTQHRTLLYSGELTDPQPPTKTDQKLWMQLEGRAAKSVFNKLKSTSQETVNVNGYTAIEKRREGLLCRSATKARDYRCTFQIDLTNGQVLSVPVVDLTEPASRYENFIKTKARYKVYSSGIGDPTLPQFGKSKLAFYIEGPAAKRLYSAIDPDYPDDCNSDEPLYRLRLRAGYGVQC